MKVALIGAGGFVGARIIESFQLGEGPSLTAIGRHPAELTSAARFAIDTRVADFLNVESLARSFTGCSVVVHAAGGAPADLKRGATVLCRAATLAGVRRIVYLSSADVHGLCPPVGTDEKSALHPRHVDETHHALVQAERQLFTEARQFGLTTFALRPALVYGPRSKVIAQLASALRKERAGLIQNGDGICNCVYIDNLVAAVRLTLRAKTGAGSAFLIADKETLTWREFFHAAASEFSSSAGSILSLGEVPADSSPSAADEAPAPLALPPDLIARQRCTWKLPIARAAQELGYEPPVPFAEAMRRSFAWWRFAQGEFSVAA